MEFNTLTDKNSDSYIIRKLLMGSLAVLIIVFLTSTIGMLVDGIIIGKCLGVDSTVAYGLASPIFIFTAAIAGIFSTGCQTLCGSALGKGDIKKANEILSVSTISSFIVGIVAMLILLVFIKPICMLLGAKSDVIYPLTRDYLFGLAFSVPIICCSSISSIMQLDKDKTRPIFSTIIMTIINIAGDLLNVYVFKGGMLGMSIATSISYLVSLIILCLHFSKKDILFKLSFKHIEWKHLKDVITIGLPSAISRASMPLRNLCINRLLLVVASSSAVAAFSMQGSLNSLFGSIGGAIGMSVLLVSGIIYGEEDIPSISKLLKEALKIGVVLTSIVAIILFIFASFFTNLFLKDTSVLTLANTCVRFYAISIPLHTINTIFMNYYQGVHNVKLAHIIGVLDNFFYTTVLSLILGNIIGLNGVWMSLIISEIVMIITILIIASLHNKKFPTSLDDLLLLSKGFGVSKEDRFDTSITTMDEVINLSTRIEDFFKERNQYDTRSMSIALCVEEMVGNIIEHGFNDNKKHSIDVRLIKKNDEYIIRIRDDCRPFDPRKQMELYNKDDETSNVGLRMIYGLVKEVKYINTMNMNNLMIRI